MKVRFDALDVTAMAALWQRTLTGRRVINIYNADSDSSNNSNYIFKLDGEPKAFLLMESGIRFHPLTHYSSESHAFPSPFCAKLRQHLRGLRLERVQQLGANDRVVLFQFGSGSSSKYVILELYSKGNLLLCDKDFLILAALRSHVYQQHKQQQQQQQDDSAAADTTADTTVAVQVGNVYPVSYATSGLPKEEEDDDDDETKRSGILSDNYQQWIQQQLSEENDLTTKSKKKKKKQPLTLKTLLLKPTSGVSQYGPALLEHCILSAQLEPHKALLEQQEQQQQQLQESDWQTLQTCLQTKAPAVLQALQRGGDDESAGYILYKPRQQQQQDDDNDEENKKKNDNTTTTTSDALLPHADKMLYDFVPYLLQQHHHAAAASDDDDDEKSTTKSKSKQHASIITYPNFGAAVEDYFCHVTSQKRLLKAQAAEKAARHKLEKVRHDQQDRLVALEQEQAVLQQQAQVVQQNAHIVEQALTVINSALDSGMDWDQLEQLVEVEQQTNHNPIALLIHKLELEQDAMILRLPTTTTTMDGGYHDDNDDDNSIPTVDVKISLKETAHGNANSLFARYRASKEKAAKTVEASTKALKAAEQSAKKQLVDAQKRGKQITSSSFVTKQRKPHWFEKYHWFITSDNYLVLGGRDAHQNELLVKRYLRPGDAYLHADVHGAASCILRAKRIRSKDGKTVPVPLSEQALREAGNFTICRSSAWSSRMVTSAWWVEAHQVSKTAPTGEYLKVGSFMVRGKKNYLPPSPLEMGLAVLFRLGDEDSVARHKNDRRDFALLAMESAAEEDETSIEKERDLVPKDDTKGAEVDTTKTGTDSNDANDGETHDADPNEEDVSGSDQPDRQGDDLREETSSEMDATDTRDQISKGKAKAKRRGLSVRDRKLIKKYGSLEEAEKALAAIEPKDDPMDGESKSAPSGAASAATTATNGQGNTKRGKKSKMKKAMKKYADQDDEDRELAMLALQGGEKQRKKTERQSGPADETQQKLAAETASLLLKDPSKVAAQLPDDVRSVLAQCVTVKSDSDESEGDIRWDKFDAGTLEQLASLEPEEAQVAAAKRLLSLKTTTRIDNFSSSLGGILRTIKKYGYENLDTEPKRTLEDGSKRKTKGEKIAEAQKWKETLAEEGIVDGEIDGDNVDDTVDLSKLTGKPHPEDLLLYAVPVCAPYQTLSQYSYRVKLTPGSMKRGKAAKQCVEMFLKNDKNSAGSDRNSDLIKKVSDNDWVQVICSDVKISAPGASKATKKQKANGKKSKKKK